MITQQNCLAQKEGLRKLGYWVIKNPNWNYRKSNNFRFEYGSPSIRSEISSIQTELSFSSSTRTMNTPTDKLKKNAKEVTVWQITYSSSMHMVNSSNISKCGSLQKHWQRCMLSMPEMFHAYLVNVDSKDRCTQDLLAIQTSSHKNNWTQLWTMDSRAGSSLRRIQFRFFFFLQLLIGYVK